MQLSLFCRGEHALLIVAAAASLLRTTMACMAMVPTDPATTRLPVVTTVAPAPTTNAPGATTTAAGPTTTTTQTTTTPTTTTTTTPIPCAACAAPKYVAPTACPAGFYCAEVELLVVTKDPCVNAKCTKGQLSVVNAGAPVNVASLQCDMMPPPMYIDPAAPATKYADGPDAFCTVATPCMCPMFTYDPAAQPQATTLVPPAMPPTTNVYGCPLLVCTMNTVMGDSGKTMTYETLSCSDIKGGYIDQNKNLVAPMIGCYKCLCKPKVTSNLLCPPGMFCYTFPLDKDSYGSCMPLCNGASGDQLLFFDPASPTKYTIAAPGGFKCQVDGTFSPTLDQATCVAAAGTTGTYEMLNQFSRATCQKLAELPGGNFAGIRYKEVVDPLGTIGDIFIEAVCETGLLQVLGATSNTAVTVPFAWCGVETFNAWRTFMTGISMNMATCVPNGCDACLTNAGIALGGPIIATGAWGICTVSCNNGAQLNFKYGGTATTVASVTCNQENMIPKFVDPIGNERIIDAGTYMCA